MHVAGTILVVGAVISLVFCDPRNLHGKCSIRINEVFLGQDTEGYVELGKICPKDKTFHESKTLSGFSILVLNAQNNDLICVHSKKLNAEKLQEPISTALGTQTTDGSISDRSLASTLEGARSRGIQSVFNSQTTTHRVSSQNQDVTERPTGDANQFELQPNARLFYVLKTSKLISIKSGILVIVVLRMDYQKARQRLPCKINKRLDDADVLDIQDNLHDFIILYANSDHGTSDIVRPLLAPSVLILEYVLPVLPSNIIDKGYSKCDYLVDNSIPSNFKMSQLTEGKQNLCKLSGLSTNKVHVFPYSFKGTSFDASAKKLIMNLVSSLTFYKFDKTFFDKTPNKLAANLLNIAEMSISRIRTQHESEAISKKKEKRKGYFKVMSAMDDTKRELLYKAITSFYAQNKVATILQIHTEFVQLVKLHQLGELEKTGPQPLNEDDKDLFTCGLTTFRKIMKNEGYKFGKLALRDSVIFEPKKILWRRKYLNRMRLNRESEEFDVLFLDETFIDPHSRVNVGIIKKCYKDYSERRAFTYKNHKVSRGGRIIIMACGGKNGFIHASHLVWKVSSKQTGEDYHQNVNNKVFQEWFEKLMDNVEGHEKKYIFVIDNAPYHTTLNAPRSNANKGELISFLKKENEESGLILPDNFENLLYVELKEIVKKIKEETPRYTIDKIARERGHEIVRIPPYNCDLNPIELVWKDIKTQVKKTNVQQNIDEQVIQAKNALYTYTADYWKRHIGHVEKLEDAYYTGDTAFDSLLNDNEEVRAEAENLSNAEEAREERFQNNISDNEQKSDAELEETVNTVE